MKIGLIARCEEARGLAIQSKNFYDHMPVERVLLVRMPRADCIERPEWYPGSWPIQYDGINHQLNENLVRQWLDGLDVVFTAETPYDWRLPHWAREMGVKTIIQGNPEFYRHNQPQWSWQAHPDEWWWPTSWRLQHLPKGRVMPVPMPERPDVASHDADGPLRILHVMGKRAFEDRNGTQLLADALRCVTRDVIVTMHGIDGELPNYQTPPNVERILVPDSIEDRWAMYENQHLLFLPRRYGGLCLPALEAAACGLAVVMPMWPPNDELCTSLRMAVTRTKYVDLACGSVEAVDNDHMDVGEFINTSLADPSARQLILRSQRHARESVPLWGVWRDRYLKAMEDLL